jgi:hypothetical protein
MFSKNFGLRTVFIEKLKVLDNFEKISIKHSFSRKFLYKNSSNKIEVTRTFSSQRTYPMIMTCNQDRQTQLRQHHEVFR